MGRGGGRIKRIKIRLPAVNDASLELVKEAKLLLFTLLVRRRKRWSDDRCAAGVRTPFSCKHCAAIFPRDDGRHPSQLAERAIGHPPPRINAHLLAEPAYISREEKLFKLAQKSVFSKRGKSLTQKKGC